MSSETAQAPVETDPEIKQHPKATPTLQAGENKPKRRRHKLDAQPGPSAQPMQGQQQQPQQAQIDIDRVRVELEDFASLINRSYEALVQVRRFHVENQQLRQWRDIVAPRVKATEDLVAGLRVLTTTKAKSIPAPILDTIQGLLGKFDKAVQPKAPKEGQQQ